MLVQNLQIWVSIDQSYLGFHFHLKVQWGSPRRTTIAAVGAVLIAPVIPKQDILCSLQSSA
jgi:hypothetical protein